MESISQSKLSKPVKPKTCLHRCPCKDEKCHLGISAIIPKYVQGEWCLSVKSNLVLREGKTVINSNLMVYLFCLTKGDKLFLDDFFDPQLASFGLSDLYFHKSHFSYF